MSQGNQAASNDGKRKECSGAFRIECTLLTPSLIFAQYKTSELHKCKIVNLC